MSNGPAPAPPAEEDSLQSPRRPPQREREATVPGRAGDIGLIVLGEEAGARAAEAVGDDVGVDDRDGVAACTRGNLITL